MLGKKLRHDQDRQPVARARALCAPATGCLWNPSTRLRAGRGQQVLEYAILIAAISTALLTMYVYSKRGLQAVIKAQTDSMGAQEDSEPIMTSVVTTSNSTVDTFANETRHIGMQGDERTYNFESLSVSAGNTTSFSERY